MKRKLLWMLVVLTALPAAALAAEEPLHTYVIKKGDTLWGISERFMEDPYYWPSLWSNNPDISNPHFIYPGQKLAIYDGRIEIVPKKEAPAEPEETAPEDLQEKEPAPEPAPAQAQEAVTIQTGDGAGGFISKAALESAGILVDTIDNRILMATGDKVFLQLDNLAAAEPGDTFTLFRTLDEVTHPVSGETLGRQIVELGTVQVTEKNSSVATGVITAANREIERGARLRPYQPPRTEVSLKKAPEPLSGYLVAGQGNKIALQKHDIVYVDLGSAEGLEPGNLLNISRPRELTELALKTDEIELPEVLLGRAVVVETQPHTAAALVLKSVHPIYRGDKVSTVAP